MDKKAICRSKLLYGIHAFFQERDFIWLDVPSLVDFPGIEANIGFFRCEKKYLHPSPEVEIKKILARESYEKVYYLGHVFRKENMDKTHREEFMMLEWYRRRATLKDLEKDLTSLVYHLSEIVMDCGIDLDFSPFPFRRYSVKELFIEKYDIDLCNISEIELKKKFEKITGRSADYEIDDIFFLLYLPMEEKLLKDSSPIFIHDYPVFISSLARITSDCPKIVRRFEYYIPPVEIANAYEELRGKDNYLRRFDFINSLRIKKGLPPVENFREFCDLMDKIGDYGGAALGVDRLIMRLSGSTDIGEISYS